MPLNEREQRILEEIERQFYEEDPKLAEHVAKTTLGSMSKRRQRVAAAGFVLGLVAMLGLFTWNTFAALAGFLVMVGSAAWFALDYRRRNGSGAINLGASPLSDRLRRRWRREG
jgi:hypothetical protein